MCQVYILKSLIKGSYYVGSTSRKVEERVLEHNKGLSKYTKSARPWILKYTEFFEDLAAARSREMQIKSWKKRAAIEKLFT